MRGFIAGATRSAAVGERRLGEHVVGDPACELGERVRRARRDHQEVGAREMRIRGPHRRPAGQREERLGAHEALGAGCDEGTTSWPAFTSSRVSSHAL